MQFGRSKYCLKSRKSSNDWDQRCDVTSTYVFQSRSSTVAQCNRRSTISWIGCFAFIYSILVYAFQFCNFAIELRQQSQNIANIFLKLFDHLSILSLTNNNNLKFAKIKKKIASPLLHGIPWVTQYKHCRWVVHSCFFRNQLLSPYPYKRLTCQIDVCKNQYLLPEPLYITYAVCLNLMH